MHLVHFNKGEVFSQVHLTNDMYVQLYIDYKDDMIREAAIILAYDGHHQQLTTLINL